MKIHFRNALLDQNWDYELSPCSVVPRLYEHIILPVGEQRPDGKFDLREYKVDIVQWWPSEGFVRVFVTPTRGHVSAPV